MTLPSPPRVATDCLHSDWLLWWIPALPSICFPLKSPAVVIEYSCEEAAVNLVWISLILVALKSPRKGFVMGYNIL